MFLAGMVSGPLALGILKGLHEKRGWHGWQYLFAIGRLHHHPINKI